VSDEDVVTRMPATCPKRVVRVGFVKFGERHDTRTDRPYTAADRRPTNQVSAWQVERRLAKSPDTRDILVAFSRDVARVGGRVGEDVG